MPSTLSFCIYYVSSLFLFSFVFVLLCFSPLFFLSLSPILWLFVYLFPFRLRQKESSVGGAATVVKAFDINPEANKVYALSFGEGPSGRSLTAVTARELDELKGDLWMMSPPCQPYTVQGKA